MSSSAQLHREFTEEVRLADPEQRHLLRKRKGETLEAFVNAGGNATIMFRSARGRRFLVVTMSPTKRGRRDVMQVIDESSVKQPRETAIEALHITHDEFNFVGDTAAGEKFGGDVRAINSIWNRG